MASRGHQKGLPCVMLVSPKMLEKHFGHRIKILGSSTGLHLVAQFRDLQFNDSFFAGLEQAGARFYPVGLHALQPEQHKDKILIGYGNLSTDEITRGIATLADHLNRNLVNCQKQDHTDVIVTIGALLECTSNMGCHK